MAASGGTTISSRWRIGVIWHTQGSGKSLTMAFYAGCIIREPFLAAHVVHVDCLASGLGPGLQGLRLID